MSNGDNRLFLYENVVDLAISAGDLYVDNKPMNNKNLIAHKGINNDIYFVIRNRDRKLQNVFSETLRAYLINPTTKARVVSRILEHTSEVGKVKLVLSAGDLAQVNPGLHHIYITRSVDELTDRPLFTDQNSSLQFDIQISDQVSIQPIATQSDTVFFQTQNTSTGDPANVYVSDSMYGNLDRNFTNAQHTMAFYPAQYTGQVLVQASSLSSAPSPEDDSDHWYTLSTLDISHKYLATGNVIITETPLGTSTGSVSSLGLTALVITDNENSNVETNTSTLSLASASTLNDVVTTINLAANTNANVVASIISVEDTLLNTKTYQLKLAGMDYSISGVSVAKLGLTVDTFKKPESNIVTQTFQTNCNWVRAVIKPTSGTISKVLLRN